MISLHVVSVFAMLGIFFMPVPAAAQGAVGTLVGNVRDETGGAVPGATITAVEMRTNISRTALSNETGNYTVTNLTPGVYRVEGELSGFRKFSREGVEVNANTTVRVDIGLVIGQLEESLMVTGESPLLQTDRTDTGRIIESVQIVQMPLGFNRNFQGMLVTVPGPSRPFRPHSEFYNSQDSLSSNVNGQSRQTNNVQLEGADNSDNNGSLAFLIPSAEAIETVSVTTSNYNRIWSSTLVQEIRFGRTSHHNEAVSDADGLNTSDEVGIRGVNVNRFTSGITTIDVSGYNAALVGFSASLPWDRAERTLNLATTVTKLRGNHTLKIGGDLRQNRFFLLQVQDNGGPRGVFRFRGAQTAVPSDVNATNGYANAVAAFLLDVPQSLARDLITDIDPGGRHTSVFTYLHDKWQVRPGITIDLGLRHEYYTPLVGLTGRGGMASYDPAANTLRVAGYGEVPENLGVTRYWKNFNPRTGVSWRLAETNVVRAGYGVSALPWPSSYGLNYPAKQNNQINPPNSFAAAGSLAAGMPPPNFAVIPDSGIIPAAPFNAQGLTVVPSDRREGRLHSWNVAYQMTLPGAFTGEVAYVGNRGEDVLATVDINAGYVLGADRAGQPLFTTFGRSASTNSVTPVTSTYHSMQVKVDRRLSGGLLVTNSYTLGRAYSYSNGDGALQVTGVFSAISGTPIDFTASAASLRAPGNDQTPNATGKPAVLGGIGAGALWFDTSVFSAAAPGTWGNVGRRELLTGPAYVNLDASLVKIIRFGSRRAEVRADFFNATNTPHYANPNGTFGNGNFGRITEILPLTERVIRFGGRFLF